TVISLGDCGVNDLDHDRADINARAVSLYIGNDRLIGDVKREICIDRYFFARRGDLDMLVAHEYSGCVLAARTQGCRRRRIREKGMEQAHGHAKGARHWSYIRPV